MLYSWTGHKYLIRLAWWIRKSAHVHCLSCSNYNNGCCKFEVRIWTFSSMSESSLNKSKKHALYMNGQTVTWGISRRGLIAVSLCRDPGQFLLCSVDNKVTLRLTFPRLLRYSFVSIIPTTLPYCFQPNATYRIQAGKCSIYRNKEITFKISRSVR